MDPIEIVTSVQRRRRWSPAEKKAIVEESEQPGMSISAVARKYGIHPNQLFTWRRLFNPHSELWPSSTECMWNFGQLRINLKSWLP